MRRSRGGLPALAAAVLIGLAVSAAAGERGTAYRAEGRCGPYPRLPAETMKGLCAGIVAGPADGLRMPRTMVEIAPGRFVVADMGSWNKGDGRLLLLTVDPPPAVRVEVLFDRLDVPHGLALGPDGRVYVGEQDEIWRFDPRRPRETRESVLSDFPHEGLHRLKVLLFDRDGSLIVNLGAVTDRCEKENGRVMWPCPADRADAKEAALWRIAFDRPGGKVASFTPVARGLRNSVALALEPRSGLLLQGENNIDLEDPDEPPEELNAIRQGAHYGWPYCTGLGDVVPDYRDRRPDCARYEKPVALLPPHSAPLAMLYEPADGLPGLAGKLVVTLHGYRATGHRVVACEVGPDGRPVTRRGGMARCEDVIGGWEARAGSRPKGAPVGLLRARDGRLWLTEDKNRAIMVLMEDRGGGSGGTSGEGKSLESVSAPRAPRGWGALYATTLRPRCGGCHDLLKGGDADQAWSAAVEAGWADAADARGWLLIRATEGKGVRRAMPPPAGFAPSSREARRLAEFLARSTP